MTLEEAQRVAQVCETADYNCQFCVRRITDQLKVRFPEFQWVYNPTNNTIEVSALAQPVAVPAVE